MRLAIGRISDGEVEYAKKICSFVRDIYRELTLLVPIMEDNADMKKKMETMLQSVVKIENGTVPLLTLWSLLKLLQYYVKLLVIFQLAYMLVKFKFPRISLISNENIIFSTLLWCICSLLQCTCSRIRVYSIARYQWSRFLPLWCSRLRTMNKKLYLSGIV